MWRLPLNCENERPPTGINRPASQLTFSCAIAGKAEVYLMKLTVTAYYLKEFNHPCYLLHLWLSCQQVKMCAENEV